MSISIEPSVNIKENKTTRRDISSQILGATVGICARKPVARVTHKIFLVPYKTLYKSKVVEKYKSEYNGAVDSVLKHSKLDATGLKIYDLNENNCEEVSKIFVDNLPNPIKRKIKSKPESLKSLYKKLESISKGEYSIYNQISNNIFFNKEKRHWSVFHEIGHSYNNNISSLGKLLKHLRIGSSRYSQYGVSALSLLVLLTNKRRKEEKPKNKLDSAIQKIRKNAGLITFSLGLPVIAEEGLASIHAAKLTKPFVSKGAYKMLNKFNLYGLLTYLGLEMASVSAMVSMREIKDFIVGRKNK